ncbi:MAG: quinolinate synthase NadA [Candidatus Poribacteria bacterium]
MSRQLRAVDTPERVSIVATEDGVFHQILQKVPEKVLIQAPGIDESCSCNQCPFMRLNTLEKLYLALRDLEPVVSVAEPIRSAALKPIELMLELS